jgi:methionine-rich copper-binding protein CopC
VFKNLPAALMWTALLTTQAAFGHAKLQTSSPADHAQLATAPPTLTLTFNERAQLAVLKLKTATSEIPVAVDHGAKAATTVVVTLPALAPGTYEVQWTAMAADDGHITKGSLSFPVLAAQSR